MVVMRQLAAIAGSRVLYLAGVMDEVIVCCDVDFLLSGNRFLLQLAKIFSSGAPTLIENDVAVCSFFFDIVDGQSFLLSSAMK